MNPGIIENKIALLHLTGWKVLCFVDRASRYNRVKKTQLDAQITLSIFRQPVQFSGVSRAHHQEVQPYIYNSWYLLYILEDCLLSLLFWDQN
jgi:hypothetical protein